MAASPGKFGSASFFLYVDGYNLASSKLQEFRYKREAIQEKSDGLGDGYDEFTPTGKNRVEIAQAGAFFDTSTNGGHAALAGSVPGSPQAAVRIATWGFAGNTIGESFYGVQGAYTQAYEVLGELGLLTKANAEYAVTGRVDLGVILQELEAKTADWNTKTSAEQVDSGAASTAGAVGYLQIVAASGFTNFVGKIRHSSDDISYSDLITFTDSVIAPSAQRVEVAGTVNRYLSFDGNITGSGSITVMVGLSRLPA